MFTTNSIATKTNDSSLFNQGQSIQSPQELYAKCRDLVFSLVDTTSPDIYYRVYENSQDSYNGFGLHEKLIQNGMSIVDISIGTLDYPWFAADANQLNEVSMIELQQLANRETDISVSPKLRAIANFVAKLPPYLKFYHYHGLDGTRAVTVEDVLNNIKFNVILTSSSYQ